VGLLAEHTGQFRDPNSSILLSVLANVMLAPVLLLAPFSGAWVDRWNLKRVMVRSDLLRCVIVMAIPVLYGMTHLSAVVFVLVFLLFTCNVFFLPAKSAITPEIVPPPQLLAANALLAGAGIAATAVGALAGGWIIDHWGWATAMIVNGGTYFVSVIALLAIRYRPHAHHAAPGVSLTGYLREVAQGWGVVRGNRTVGLALVALAAVWIGGGFLHVAGNPHIQVSAQKPGIERVGVLMCVLGLGSGIGTWWVNAHGRRFPRGVLLGIGLLLAGGGITLFALSTRFAVFCVAGFIAGLAAAPAFTLSETLLQEGTEPRQRGRVFSARDFVTRLVFLGAVTLAAAAARGFGHGNALLIGAAIVAAAGAIVLWMGSRSRAPGTTRDERAIDLGPIS
jgi:MFS family permease